MFAICLVRTLGETIGNHSGIPIQNDQWNVFWHIIEASVAVFVVSLTAFRSLYGIKTLQEKEYKNRCEGWLASHRRNLLSRKKCRVDEFGDPVLDAHYSLPRIPGATLAGIRTIIGGKTADSTQALSSCAGLIVADETQEMEPIANRVADDSDV